MLTIVEQKTPTVDQVKTRSLLFNWICSPVRLRIIATQRHANVDWETPEPSCNGALRQIPWATKVSDINARIKALQNALEVFRQKWSETYLDAVECSDVVRGRLESFEPLCQWGNLVYDVKQEDADRWKAVSTSSELCDLAVEGHRLYGLIFKQHNGLKAWMDGLPVGCRLYIEWTKEDRDCAGISSIPWGLMYQVGEGEEEPKRGEAVNPLNFLGLKYRLEYVESRASLSMGLGRPERAFRGHVFFWKGMNKPEYAEASAQHRSWSKLPNFYAVPDKWPPTLSDNDYKGRAKELLKAEEPSPMTLLYVYCQCDFKETKPELYFGDPNPPEVTLLEGDLPDPGNEFRHHPLVFVNVCRSNWPVGVVMANLLESNFLERGCRVYLGTVNRVPVRIASRFAEAFFYFFLPRRVNEIPLSAGESVSQARLFLWTRYKNISGLFYNFVNFYDIYMTNDNEFSSAYPPTRGLPRHARHRAQLLPG